MPLSLCFNCLKKVKILLPILLTWGIFSSCPPTATAQKAQPTPDCKGVSTLEQWYKETDLWRFKNETCKPAPAVQAYSHTPIDALDLWKEFRFSTADAEKKYKYSLVTVKGTILNTGNSFLGFPELLFQTDNTYNMVLCQFSKNDQELVSNLKPKQHVVVSGTVKKWNKIGILDIEDCTLLEVESD